MTNQTDTQAIAETDPEQLPVAEHDLHGWTHLAGLYAGEHVAAKEFVIGANFVALGASTQDILIGHAGRAGCDPRIRRHDYG